MPPPKKSIAKQAFSVTKSALKRTSPLSARLKNKIKVAIADYRAIESKSVSYDSFFNLCHSLFDVIKLSLNGDRRVTNQYFFYLSQIILNIAHKYKDQNEIKNTHAFKQEVRDEMDATLLPMLSYYLPSRCQSAHNVPGHMENGNRLIAIEDIMKKIGVVNKHSSASVKLDHVNAMLDLHSPQYMQTLNTLQPNLRGIDLYNHFSAQSLIKTDNIWMADTHDAIAAALGAMVSASDRVLKNIQDQEKAEKIFCAIRPPSHHAHYEHPEGFCFSSTLVAAAIKFMEAGVPVLIIDMDVHHGDGTYAQLQRIMQNNKKYKQLCRFIDVYVKNSFIHNQPQTADPEYKDVMTLHELESGYTGSDLLDKIKKSHAGFHGFKPGVILVSAGFDATQKEKFGGGLIPSDYAAIGAYFASLCDHMISFLEGGYDYKHSLPESVFHYIVGMGELTPQMQDKQAPYPGDIKSALEFLYQHCVTPLMAQTCSQYSPRM